MNKHAETALKASIPLALIGAMVFAVPQFAKEKNSNASFDSTVKVNNDISFASFESPKGFSPVSGHSAEGFAPLKAAQNPGAWINDSKTCKLTPTIEALPESLKSKDDSFLSKKYIYDEAEKYDYVQSETKNISLKRTVGDSIASFYASYEVPNDASINDDINSGDYYRTTVARVIAQPVPFPQDINIPDSENRKGIPAIILNYDCLSKNDFKENEFKKIANAVLLDFETDHDHKAPVKQKDKQAPSAIDDPSDDLEDGYTIIPKKFDNPADVVDKGRSRGADDTRVIETENEQVQIPTPEWKE